jgi:prevent-host-death family protein
MAVVNVHEAKTHLSRLLSRVEKGEEVVIARAGKPVARIVPLEGGRRDRVPGSARGLIVLKRSFHGPLPQSVIAEFEK